MVIIYNKSDYLTKVSDIEAEQWCRIKYWQFNNKLPDGQLYFGKYLFFSRI
jgi:hypothetical protein